nr:adenosylcobinamide-GDP ribazoletransferase [Solimonas marina]
MPAWPLLVALQFLTVLPLRLPPPSATALARSLCWYPLVGALLGAVLWALSMMLGDAPAPLRAALLLAAWALMTGFLHLDGLADCADAWIGGRGDRERTLAIMKDPRAGPAAIVTLLLVVLLKFAALQAVAPAAALVAVPMLARASAPVLFATTRYVRPGGLGSAMASAQCSSAFLVAGLSVALACAIGAAAAAVAAILVLVLVRTAAQSRLGGFTGDVAGAAIEIIEAAALLALTV